MFIYYSEAVYHGLTGANHMYQVLLVLCYIEVYSWKAGGYCQHFGGISLEAECCVEGVLSALCTCSHADGLRFAATSWWCR